MTKSTIDAQATETGTQLLSKESLAKRLGVSVRTIENMVKAGSFPAGVRIGRFIYWSEKVITRWQNQLFQAQEKFQF